ncbi:MAG: flagellar biosynthesis regulator FlaF [Rhodospirillaceae bacterium]
MPPPTRPNPYSNVPNVAADPRQVEGWALTETAMRMKAAQREPVDEAALLHAVRLNWRLWTIFQASLLEPDCPVPLDIRSNILSLANFVDKHTASIISAPQASKLDVLIRVNREIAGGLMTAAAAPATAPAVPSDQKPINTRA